ncbi:MAG: glycoside hydrolase family 9 protein, partial [Verrucomicrobiota bacterium]
MFSVFACWLLLALPSRASGLDESNPLAMPEPGEHALRILSPTLLELTLVTRKDPDPARVPQWDFVGANFQLNLPSPSEFAVTAGAQTVTVKSVGFKRRPLYAPLKRRDLRLLNQLYLELTTPLAGGQSVEVKNPNARLWNSAMQFKATLDPLRFTPAIHVNQVGYAPSHPKQAFVGYYLGSLGEMNIDPASGFQLVRADSGQVVFQGALVLRRDTGYTYSPQPYQKVYEADFTAFTTPGEYRVVVPGLGGSFAFLIDDGTPAAFARTYALGLYHQRCGLKNESPFTRHAHDACHLAPADVPTMSYQKVQDFLAEVTGDYATNPRHTAPRLKDVNSSRYPFVKQGKVDVSGGHHDAGDYSKYTINSAGLIHYLVFAVDAFAGVGALDNLGIPESGDGRSDLLQEAKWEADFLARMQDADGGFYFLVYPRDRRYEDDVLPDKGDPQVVWPKTTAVTAAAVAALAEIGSSPLFRQQFPLEAARYLQQAQLGWAFLELAIAQYGKDGAYQKITHYGNEFMHDDELAWAAAALFVATGNPLYHERLKSWYDPANPNTRRWSWWRLFEGYGCAARTYAFATRTGRLSAALLDASYLAKCEAEIKGAADDHLSFANQNAYGTSFPLLNKQYRSAGWYFSSERAFDLTVAYQLESRSDYLKAILSNLAYEAGANPVNVSYITGLGWKRQRDIVHQFAQNDHRVLPPTGIPLGNIQSGFSWLYHYQSELGALAYPPDGATTAPYPYYDRWGDTFNTTTEFVVVDQARSLASLSFLMAQSSVKSQSWKSAAAQIIGLPSTNAALENVTATLSVPGLDLSQAQIVWEARDQQPAFGPAFTFAPRYPGEQWVEVEALLPDGRRLFAATNFVATFSPNEPANSYQSAPLEVRPETVALFHFDDLTDASGRQANLTIYGAAALDTANVGWMASRT